MRVDVQPSRIAAGALAALLALASTASATPISYSLLILPGTVGSNTYWPSGRLGAVSFGQSSNHVSLTFVFQGDTSTVVPFSLPEPHNPPQAASGFVNLIGTASVTVTDLGSNLGSVLAQGTFLPSAGIFVSIDNFNGGIGFGSFGAPPGSSRFPGQPVYPYGVYPLGGALKQYDLQGPFAMTFPFPAVSCVGFDLTLQCGSPLALPTTAGDLFIDTSISISQLLGLFAAQLQPVVPFSVLKARVELDDSRAESFQVEGSFTLGAGSNGINPLTDVVTLQVGTSTFSIPPGSFSLTPTGRFVFEGTVQATRLRLGITPTTAGSYSFGAEAAEAGAAAAAVTDAAHASITVGLTIGDDSGTTAARVEPD